MAAASRAACGFDRRRAAIASQGRPAPAKHSECDPHQEAHGVGVAAEIRT